MSLVKIVLTVMLSFSSGVVISGAVFAFIAIIGVVPNIAHKTNTQKYIRLYEEVIIFAGIFATLTSFIDFYFPINSILIMFYGFSMGVFFGVLASSLAEVLDVIPVISRRFGINRGVYWFMFAIGIGKLMGSLIYFYEK